MNKQVFVFILLFIALSHAVSFQEAFGMSKASTGYTYGNANCNVNVTGCAELKASCQGPVNSSSPCYSSLTGEINGSCCAENLWCVSGTCQRDNYGSTCTVNNTGTVCLPDHDGTMTTGCINGQCTELYGAGDTCTNSTNCIADSIATLICSNTSNTCVGLALGAICNSTWDMNGRVSQCAAPNYCGVQNTTTQTFVCTAPSTSSCATTACNQLNVCNDGTCVGIGSVAANGASTTPFACSSGLTWNMTNCITSPGGVLNSCTANSDCSQYNSGNVTSMCQCFPQSGNSYCEMTNTSNIPLYNSQLLTLATCLNTNNCSYNGHHALSTGDPVHNANSAPNSCSYVNCWSAYKKYKGESCSTLDDQFGSCFYSPECGGFPVWAIVVIVIVAVILVLAVVVVIFLVLRRRKDYASI